MRELQVTYRIDEKQYKKLLELLDVVRETESPSVEGTYPFKDWTVEKVFNICMIAGSKYKIDESINEMFWHFKKEDHTVAEEDKEDCEQSL